MKPTLCHGARKQNLISLGSKVRIDLCQRTRSRLFSPWNRQVCVCSVPQTWEKRNNKIQGFFSTLFYLLVLEYILKKQSLRIKWWVCKSYLSRVAAKNDCHLLNLWMKFAYHYEFFLCSNFNYFNAWSLLEYTYCLFLNSRV